jgi:HTH-type transcriptional regulator/antitoxin MqsA
MKNCPICGGNTNRESKNIEFDYKGKKLIIAMLGDYCQACGESFHTVQDQKIIDQNIALAKREAESLLFPKELKRIRKKLHISQEEAAEYLGGGIRAFSKYENALVNQPRALDVVFKLLDMGKVSWDDIKSVSGVKPPISC